MTTGVRIAEFDLWREGYGGAVVVAYLAGTTTLANLFYDEALTVVAPNPVTLASRSRGGASFGKWQAPIYVGVAIELRINSIDQSGVMRPPLTSLDAQDASLATVQAISGSQDHTLADIVDRSVDVLDYGVFLPTSNLSASSSTNATTLAAAAGAAAAKGGSRVRVPAGTFAFTTLSLAVGVILSGAGDGATILQSVQASAVLTLAGAGAGFENITIDGVSQQAGSIGVTHKGVNQTYIRNATVKRFETNHYAKGGQRNDWRNYNIDTGTSGALLRGMLDTVDGTDFLNNYWQGSVSNCTGVGVELKYVDKKVWNNTLALGLISNTGTAMRLFGARHTELAQCWFDGNIADLEMLDGTDASHSDENTVVGLHINGGKISSAMSFTGVCQDIVFDRTLLAGGTYTLTSVTNTILAKDCLEDDSVVLAGSDATKWMRDRSILGDAPGTFGLTTNNTATEAWTYALDPGERIAIEATIVANGKNCDDAAVYRIYRAVHRPPSTLLYDGQTANFLAGSTLTGGTSGATALVVADADSGSSGTLKLRDISGAFVDNETITDTSGGTAVANGTLNAQNAALLGATVQMATAYESDATWDCDFGVTAGNVRILVTGATGKSIEWTTSARVTSSG